MAEFGPLNMDPSGAHPTSSLTSRILRSDTSTTGAQGFKAGTSTTGSSGTNFFTLIYGRLPDKEDIYGAGVTDSNLSLSGLQLSFTISSADSDTEYYVVKSLSKFDTENFPIESQGIPCYEGVERDASASATRPWTGTNGTGDIVTAGVIGDDVAGYFAGDVATSITVDLTNMVKQNSLKFGSKFAFIIRKEELEDADEHIIVADTSTIQMKLLYTDPEPTMPVIKLEADTDYRSSIVTMTTKPSDKDITEFATVWKDGGTDTFENRVGVHYSATNRVQFNGGSQFATGIFKEVDGDIADGFLDGEGVEDNLVVWASDMSASGTTTNVKNRTMSNRVSHSRLSCTGSLSAGTAIGEELTLTINGFSDDGDSNPANFVKYGVNWNGTSTAANDDINDFTIVTLDAPASSVTVKHTYDKADTYKVNICVIDDKGFRSDFTQAASRGIVNSNPVAVLRASRDTAVRAKYGDEFSVVTLSASHSYPIGSDKQLWAYKFKHNSSTPVTTFPMENDNSSFNDVSKTIKLKCNTAGCETTVVRVYGKKSVAANGNDVADNDAAFDRYEQVFVDLSPNPDTVAESFSDVTSELFKSIDFVVVTFLDATDTAGAVYTLADSSGNIINNKIRAAKDVDAWGGYVEVTGIQVDFSASGKTIHRDTAGSFLTNGFVPGDTIWVNGAVADAANNGFFTVSAVTTDTITVNEDLVDENNDAGVDIYKVNGPTLPIASFAENTPTVTLAVRQASVTPQASSHTYQTSSFTTQQIKFVSEEYNTLDFDTEADGNHIALLSANIKRAGGIASLMALGGDLYPIGSTRTKMGTPGLTLNVRMLSQRGYRKIWNLIEGGRYQWATIDAKSIDVPTDAYKQLRLRLTDGTINKDPTMASEYTASLNFVIIGELIG
tara:strand:- start:1608 stop:4292 length:2685 start_codon:yes stop_codon:yes gene_type:complete